jgi:RNA polymerase sigma factor (sigma-70 family)
VAHEEPDAYAARRAALEAQFAALPLAGSVAYWQAIERTDGPDPLPLEVLARCYRERLTRSRSDADRILAVILRRLGPAVRRWAAQITSKSPSAKQADLQQDLEQENYVELWEELRSDGPTFLLENFAFACSRIQQHVAMDVMQRASEWKRSGVLQPKRIPRRRIDSIDATPANEGDVPLADTLADSQAHIAFDLATISDLLDEVRSLPPEDQLILLGMVCGDPTQAEIARILGVTDRTVRNRRDTIVVRLRRLYLGPEEEHHA